MVSGLPERWSRATVFPDMWVNPEEDPRNSDGVSPDGELPRLQHYLRDYRLGAPGGCVDTAAVRQDQINGWL